MLSSQVKDISALTPPFTTAQTAGLYSEGVLGVALAGRFAYQVYKALKGFKNLADRGQLSETFTYWDMEMLIWRQGRIKPRRDDDDDDSFDPNYILAGEWGDLDAPFISVS